MVNSAVVQPEEVGLGREWRFCRELDQATGYAELRIQPDTKRKR